jgi:hypothetical protein
LAPQLRRNPLGAPLISVAESGSFGFPVRCELTIWKKNRPLTQARVLSAIGDELRRYGAEPESIEDGLRAKLPLLRTRRRFRHWFSDPELWDIRTIEIVVHETERAFHLEVSGRTIASVPAFSMVSAYAVAMWLHAPALVSPLIGVVVGLMSWTNERSMFGTAVTQMVRRAESGFDVGGRLTRA